MGDVDHTNADEPAVAWGRSVLEPNRGHVREMHDGQPVTHDVDGAVVGMAICGALLVDDLAPDVMADEFGKCTVCLQVLEEIRLRAPGQPRTQDPSDRS